MSDLILCAKGRRFEGEGAFLLCVFKNNVSAAEICNYSFYDTYVAVLNGVKMMPHWDKFKRQEYWKIWVRFAWNGTGTSHGGITGASEFQTHVTKFYHTEPPFPRPTAWEFQISKHLILENSSFVWKYLLIKYLQDERRNHLPTSAIRAKGV